MVEFKSHKDLPPGPICTKYIDTVNKTGVWRTYRPEIDEEKCTRCYICWKFCPDLSIDIKDNKTPKIMYDYCKGCGICANECPKNAISMIIEE
jgi:2-oxoisovalerate ferredoxin oxidoreductase delta subunit